MGTKSRCSLLAYINIWKELLLSCLRDKAKIALFSKLSNFYFGLRHPWANPQARQRSENPTPGATRMCESPGVARGVGQAWNCLSKANKRSSISQSFICNQLSTYSLKFKILWQNSNNSMYTYKMTGPIVYCYNNKIHWKILTVSCPLFSVSWSLLAIN